VNRRRFRCPPRALRRRGVTLDNLVLVPASLLSFKDQYERLTHALPKGTVLLVLPRAGTRHRKLLVRIAQRFAAHGHQVATRTTEEVTRA
jgi:hypothetical protein